MLAQAPVFSSVKEPLVQVTLTSKGSGHALLKMHRMMRSIYTAISRRACLGDRILSRIGRSPVRKSPILISRALRISGFLQSAVTATISIMAAVGTGEVPLVCLGAPY